MSLRSIQSRDNAQYKQLRQWASSAQARRKSGMTLLDGVHLCEAWLQHRGVPALCVVHLVQCMPWACRMGRCDSAPMAFTNTTRTPLR